MAESNPIFDALDRAYEKRRQEEYAKVATPQVVDEQRFPTVEEASRYAGETPATVEGAKERVAAEIKRAEDGSWVARRVKTAVDPRPPDVDAMAFAKDAAKRVYAKNPSIPREDIEAMRAWAERRAVVNAVGAETAEKQPSTGYSMLSGAEKDAMAWGRFGMAADKATLGISGFVSRNVLNPAIEAVTGLKPATDAQMADVMGKMDKDAPRTAVLADTVGTLTGYMANPLMKAGAVARPLGQGAVAAVGFGATEAGNELSRQVMAGEDVSPSKIAAAGAQGVGAGYILGGLGPRLEAIAAKVGGRFGQAVKGALENVALTISPKVTTDRGVQIDLPRGEDFALSTVVMAAFGGARGKGLSDSFKADLAKRGVPPEEIRRIEIDMDAAMVEGQRQREAAKAGITPVEAPLERPPQSDVSAPATTESVAPTKPVSEAPERMVRVYRGEAPEGVPGQEWLRSIDRDRRGRWFTTDRKTAGDYAGDAGKIIEVEVPESVWRKAQVEAGRGREGGVGEAGAGVLPAEWVSGTKPVSVAPTAPVEAPHGRTLVGTDKRGKRVWEINGRYYTRAGKGPLGAAHPDAVAEAKASQPAAAPKPADVVRELTASPVETTMLTGGPEAISNKAASIWRGVRDTASEGVRSLRRFFTSQKAPELLAMSPVAWRHVVKADAAPQIAKAAFEVWRSEVPDKAWAPQDAAKFEAVLTENNRLGAIDARHADAAAKLQEAEKATDPKVATRLRREAAILTERAKRAEGKSEYVIGPDKPFATRQELLDFAKRPDVVEAAGRHAAWWKEHIEPRYRASVQADPDVEMPGRGRFFDARASLVAEKAGEKAGVGGVAAGKTENLRVRKSRFARTAFGDAAEGYKVKAEEYIPTALTDVIPKGGWRAAVDTLVKEGHGVVVKPNEKPPDEINGERAMPFDIGPGNGKVYLPNTLHDLLYHIRQTAPKSKIPVVTDLANKSTSESMALGADNIFHIFRSMGVVMSRPSTGSPVKEAVANLVAWPVMRAIDFGRLMRRMKSGVTPREGLEMAEAEVRERGDVYQRNDKGDVVTGPDGKPVRMDANIYGLRWLGRFGSAMDAAGRAELYATIKRMKKAGLNIDDSPEAISRFVGQMGRYGRAWYGPVQRGLSDTGISPFFEAWRNARGNAGRSLILESALTPKDRATAIKLRTVMLTKLAGLFTTAGIINTITDGTPFGQSDVPTGAIVLHRDDKTGKAVTFDFLKMVGIRQAMNALGVTAALETARNGGTVGQGAMRAAGSLAAEAVRPFTGPLTTAATIALTGSRPDQLARGQTDGVVPAAATEGGLLRRRAVEATKNLFPVHGLVAEYGARWFGGEYIRDILNAGSDVTPDMMDEMSEMLRTASINRTVGADKAQTYAERSKMGYLFGTYLDAVKADIRKAPPDKIQAVVEKALSDIDARDDLDSASKAKAKKAVQMYAASRGKGR